VPGLFSLWRLAVRTGLLSSRFVCFFFVLRIFKRPLEFTGLLKRRGFAFWDLGMVMKYKVAPMLLMHACVCYRSQLCYEQWQTELGGKVVKRKDFINRFAAIRDDAKVSLFRYYLKFTL
jgi:hypothetical protein